MHNQRLALLRLLCSGWLLTSPGWAWAASAAASDQDRTKALALLDKYAETQAKRRSYRYVVESSTELEARVTEEPYRKMNGSSRSLERTEFRTDGDRAGARSQTWGNFRSASEFVTQDRCPHNSLLWDGRTFFNYVATADTPGRAEIDTRRNVPRYRQLLSQMQTALWRLGTGGRRFEELLRQAASLCVRTNLEQAAEGQCVVIEALTPDAKLTVWLDPERGHNLVKAVSYDRAYPISYALDGVVCKKLEGAWIPVEGYLRRNRSYRNGDYEKSVEHLKITEITLNPDHQALRSFVPDDIKNGAWAQINPNLGQRFNPKDLPTWQNGRVVDKAGRVLFDSGLKDTKANPAAPTGRR